MAGLAFGIQDGHSLVSDALGGLSLSVVGVGAFRGPALAGIGGGGRVVQVNVTYAPGISLADEHEFQARFMPFLERALDELE